MHHVLAKRKPNIPEVDADGTNFLAVTAECTAKHGVTKKFQLLIGRAYFSKQIAEKTFPAHEKLSETFYTVDRRKFAIQRCGHRGANVCTDLAICARLHLDELPYAVVIIGHNKIAPLN
jgi:hypothetical protein